MPALSRLGTVMEQYRVKKMSSHHLFKVSEVFSKASLAFNSCDLASSMNSSVFLIWALLWPQSRSVLFWMDVKCPCFSCHQKKWMESASMK